MDNHVSRLAECASRRAGSHSIKKVTVTMLSVYLKKERCDGFHERK